jgi:hypothetical protein
MVYTTVDELLEDIKTEKPKGDGKVKIAYGPDMDLAILSIYSDDDGNLCIDVEDGGSTMDEDHQKSFFG